jgi:hypothetical protein
MMSYNEFVKLHRNYSPIAALSASEFFMTKVKGLPVAGCASDPSASDDITRWSGILGIDFIGFLSMG